ncbi:MAG: hypothetical protein FWE30_02510 [Bacteroidales bacterium]|nr:hypothetical protein [Bacteroidales bacterium]
MKGLRFLYGSVLCVFVFVCGFARQQQDKEENRIILIGAHKMEQFSKDGIMYRRASGQARFLHNDTYILCDTAVYDPQNNIVDAKGNVQVIQEQTQLRGETLHYVGNDNLAQVRGPLVELFDQDGNRLRTKYLDFNTKDSIGIFYNGGSMVDSDGNVLESHTGRYFSKEKRFEFEQSVEMFTDTVTVKSDFAQYQTDTRVVTLTGRVHAWHTDGYLRSEHGLYKRDQEVFRFNQNVYVQTDRQEIWADTLYFDRIHTKGSLYGNIQVLDTIQAIILLGDEGHFEQNPQKAMLTRDPVFITYDVDDNNVRDTTFVRGDTLRLISLPRYQVDSTEVEAARARLHLLLPPPEVPESEVLEPKAALLDTLRNLPLLPVPSIQTEPLDTLSQNGPPVDTVNAAPPDSLMQLPPLDSTKIHFIYAHPRVKAYRSNGQGLCDSLVYNSLDSTIRLYGQPVLWHEKNQFSADSIQFFLQNSQISRADLFSSSFIIAQEDSLLFNQIKGKDMIGYFRNNEIYSFEVLSDVELIYCIREDDLITSMNLAESQRLVVTLKDRQVQRLHYYQHTKSNVYPLYELNSDKRRLTHFDWRADERPADRFAITQRSIRPSVPETAPQEPKPLFPFTDVFFPGHIPLPVPTPTPPADTTGISPLDGPPQDSLPPFYPILDSLPYPILRDTIRIDSIRLDSTRIDSIALDLPPADAPADTLANMLAITPTVAQDSEAVKLSRKELRLQRKAIRKEKAAQRKAERLLRKQQRITRQTGAVPPS